MGCFSFLCKKCGKGIQSTSFSGQRCRLFLLNEGKVIQKRVGEYNSYGTVFINNTQRPDVEHELRESNDWDNPFTDKPTDDKNKIWSRVCDLMFGDACDGIAAYHDECYDGEIPTVKSDQDPNQGWGEDLEDFDTNTEYPGEDDAED